MGALAGAALSLVASLSVAVVDRIVGSKTSAAAVRDVETGTASPSQGSRSVDAPTGVNSQVAKKKSTAPSGSLFVKNQNPERVPNKADDLDDQVMQTTEANKEVDQSIDFRIDQ